jgi:membrane protein YdbS with pleckstrin-like domain
VEPQSLDPRIVTVWRVQALIAASVPLLAAIGLGIGAAVASPVLAVPAVAVAVVSAWSAWSVPAAQFRHWRYALDDDRLDLEHGVLWRTRSSVPHFRVQHIDIEQGPLDRRFGLARLELHTASAASDATLPGLRVERAEEIRRHVLAQAALLPTDAV